MTLIFAVQLQYMWYMYIDVHVHVYCGDFYFTPFFEKNTKAIVHGFVKNWCFQVGNGIEPFLVRMHVYIHVQYVLKLQYIAKRKSQF